MQKSKAAHVEGKAAHVLALRKTENPSRIQREHVEEPGAGVAGYTLCALRGGPDFATRSRNLTLSGLRETQSCSFLLCGSLETQR